MKRKFYHHEISNSSGRIGAIGILFIVLTSCDPLKHVIISNETKELVTVQIKQDTTSQLSLGSKSEITYTLASSGDSSEVGFIYGHGMFTKDGLTSFNSMIQKITISSGDKSCEIYGEELKKYLPDKRRGIFNNWLKLKIKNCPQQSI